MSDFDEKKLVLLSKDRFSTRTFISKINIKYNNSTWTTTRRFSAPIAGFYTRQFIDNINIEIGGATICSNYGNCVAMKNGWFKLQFFLNDPVLPLHKLMYMTMSFNRCLDKNELTYQWPDIYYMPVTEVEGDTTDTDEDINTELIVQNTDGLYNCLSFQNGLGGNVYPNCDSFRILPYYLIVQYLKGEVELYKSSANNDKADSMNIAKEMFREYRKFLKDELKLCKETSLSNL